MLHRLPTALLSLRCTRQLAPAAISPFNCSYSTVQSSEDIGPGPGSRTRSVDQATSGSQSGPARSPDAPADPAELAHNRGSDPEEMLRSSAWQAADAMSSSYDWSDQSSGGGTIIKQAPHAAGRLTEKVAGAAEVAAQAVTGAVSAMSSTVKAATGAAIGTPGHEGGVGIAGPDSSPVSDDSLDFGEQVPDTNAGTTASGEVDTASGTSDPEMLQRKVKQGGYQEAAERLMDIEGLPRDTAGPRRS